MQIMLVEDNAIFREAFKQEFCRCFPSSVVMEAANGEEAMQGIIGTHPQIIFMDINLPGADGLILTKKIKAQFPGVHIAILTNFDLPEYKQAALQYGAERYFVKDSFSWDEVEEFTKYQSI